MQKDILIVDDEVAIREVVGEILSDEGYLPRMAANSDQALGEIAKKLPDLVLLDIWLEGSRLDGIQILEALMKDHSDVPVIMFSGHGTIDTAVGAIKLGAYDFIEKPFKSERLLVAISKALETSQLKQENIALRERHVGDQKIIGSSTVINKLRNAIERVAPTNSRVLISGPPGCGKELTARSIHQFSRRSEGPFVLVHAASLSPDRVELELFGAEAGFLAPDQGRIIGQFERAHGGSLVLDEIADMPLQTQGKILRVLQDQRFVRPGGDQQVKVDVRVFATTNRDLKAEMSAGRFREDLYYRINVVPIEVPELAEHRTDIPELIEHFMNQAARNAGLAPRQVDDEAMAILQTTPWPGDIRQLRNVVEWMLIMAPGEPGVPISPNGLPPDLTSSATASMDPMSEPNFVSMPLRDARERFERAYLGAQLERFGGNISRTANFIGMERSALHRKLKALGLQGDGSSSDSAAGDSQASDRGIGDRAMGERAVGDQVTGHRGDGEDGGERSEQNDTEQAQLAT